MAQGLGKIIINYTRASSKMQWCTVHRWVNNKTWMMELTCVKLDFDESEFV